jgi:hypothetical protein
VFLPRFVIVEELIILQELFLAYIKMDRANLTGAAQGFKCTHKRL